MKAAAALSPSSSSAGSAPASLGGTTNVSCVCRLQVTDMEMLRSAAQFVVDREPMLRRTSDNRVLDHVPVDFRAIDVSGWTARDVRREVVLACHAPFPHERPPLFRIRCLLNTDVDFAPSDDDNDDDNDDDDGDEDSGPNSKADLPPPPTVVCLVADPLVCDWWSLSILLDDVRLAYQAHSTANFATLLPPHDADFWRYRRVLDEQLLGPDGDQLWAFWHSRLAGSLPALNLPVDKARPPVLSGACLSCTVRCPVEGLREVARQEGTSLFTVVLAALHTFIFRYTNQEDVIIGSELPGHTDADLHSMVGPLANTVVFRQQVTGDPSFRSFLREVRQEVISVRAHQELPFEVLLARLRRQHGGDSSNQLPFHVRYLFAEPEPSRFSGTIHDTVAAMAVGERGPAARLGRLAIVPVEVPSTLATEDVALHVAELSDELIVKWVFSKDLFERSTTRRMTHHFENLLHSIARFPDVKLSELQLMTGAERRLVLDTWNDTAQSYPSEKLLLHQLVEARAAATPDAPAVEEALTYRQLNDRANKLGHYLRFLGVQHETLVPILLERSPRFIVTLLAVLKAGGACMPLDPSTPRARMAFMLEESQARVVITSSAFESHVSSSLSSSSSPSDHTGTDDEKEAVDKNEGARRRRVVNLDKEWVLIERGSTRNLVPVGTPESLAYVLYTSGSTGRPKGVMLHHRGLVNYVSSHIDFYQMTASDRMAHLASMAFDASMAETWPTLAVGASLWHCTDRETRLVPQKLVAWMVERRVTIAFLTTQLAEAFLKLETYPDELMLRVLFTGGDKLHRGPSVEAPFRLVNIYGPTECTINATMTDVEPGLATAPTIGRVVPNMKLYVLDAHKQPVPVGVYGQLFIAGVQLGRGYFRRDDLTLERFVPNPFASVGDADKRMYATGDLVRYRQDGHIEFLGRADTQVKIRGFRIELAEIEEAIQAHFTERVKDVVVVAAQLPGREGDKTLVCYVVLWNQDEPLHVDAVRSKLADTLPEFMIPAAFVVLAAMPLNQNGKVDRGALPPPKLEDLAVREYRPPTTPVEKGVAVIAASVLGLERVGMSDSFFELGGHSLSAGQLVSRLRQTFNVELPLHHVFGSHTFADIATAVSDLKPAKTASLWSLLERTDEQRTLDDDDDDDEKEGKPVATTIPTANDHPPLPPQHEHNGDDDESKQREFHPSGPRPATANERSLLLVSALDLEASRAYNVPFACRVTSALDEGRLVRAFEQLVARHASLRTTFPDRDTAHVAPDGTLDFESVQLDSEERVSDWMLDETYRPFDLARGPLMRVRLVRIRGGSEQAYVLWTIHHIVVDLWSFVILLEDLGALYSSSQPPLHPAACLPPPVPEPTIEEDWSYWQPELAKPLPTLEMPMDGPRPPKQTYEGRAHLVEVPRDVLQRLRMLVRNEGVTLYAVLMTAYVTLLQRYTQQEDIIVGSPMAGRGDAASLESVGYFVNVLPLRVNTGGDPTFRNLLARTSRKILSALEHQQCPLSLIVERLQLERDASRAPLFQTVFVLQKPHRMGNEGLAMFFVNKPGVSLTLGDELCVESVDIGQRHAQFDLTLMMAESRDELAAAFHFNTALFSDEFVARFADHFLTLLASLVQHPHRRISALDILSRPEQRQLIKTFNDTARSLPHAGKLIHQLVQEQAARVPGRTAIDFRGRKLTYAKLNASANQLAHFLRFLGVAPDTPVLVFMERTPLYIVALLAIMKAGGACMPVDTKYPEERVRHLLALGEARMLLTQRSLVDKLPSDHKCNAVVVDHEWSFVSQGNGENLPDEITDEHLAQVIFTSGSTGNPKGVMLPHRGLINYFSWHSAVFGITEDDRHAHLASHSFDASMAETWTPLMHGAAVHLCDDEAVRLTPSLFAEWAATHRITICFMPTVLCEGFCELADYPANLALRVLFTGGDKLRRGPPAHASFRLFNFYGPCENSLGVTCREMRVGDTAPPFLLGKARDNTQVFVLDPNMHLVPVGVHGEIYLGGVQLARGYFADVERTRQSFVPNPFHDPTDPCSSAVLYKTGDMARHLPDGQLEFLGRRDAQVKIRGNRIEMGEIEAALMRDSAVADASVVCRDDARTHEKRLIAFFVAAKDKQKADDDEDAALALRHRLRKVLPDFMIPSAFVELEALPLNPNGKVDRSALPTPSSDAFTGTFIAPRSPIEEELCRLCAEVLGLERVGMGDNFFDVGGHSLAAAQLLQRIRESLDVDVPLGDLFDAPSLARLAELITIAKQTPGAALGVGGSSSSVAVTPQRKRSIGSPRAVGRVWSPRGTPNQASGGASFAAVSLSSPSARRHVSRLALQRGLSDLGTSATPSPPPPAGEVQSPSFSLGSSLPRSSGRLGRVPAPLGRFQPPRLSIDAADDDEFVDGSEDDPTAGKSSVQWLAEHVQQGEKTEEENREADMTFNQSSLWFIHKLNPASVAYTCTFAARVSKGRVDVDKLRVSLQILVERHPALRTVFFERDGSPMQRVLGRHEVDFAVVGDKDKATAALVDEEAHRSFCLEEGPVFRARLINGDTLFLIAHHITVDGWSMDMIVKELSTIYGQSPREQQQATRRPELDMLAYAQQQRALVSGDDGDRMWRFWQRTLAQPLPLMNLPTDRPRPPAQTYDGAHYKFDIAPRLAAQLRACAKSERSTLFMLLSSVFCVFLHRYTTQDDILLGTPMACRSDQTLHGLAGNLVNPVVLRVDMSGDPTFSALLRRVQKMTVDAFIHQEFPFTELVTRLQGYRDPSRNPIFQVLFSLNTFAADRELSLDESVLLEPFEVVQHASPFDLQLIVTEPALDATLQYNTTLFDESTIARMAGHYVNLLEAVVADPRVPLSDLTMLGVDEWDEIVLELNDTSSPIPRQCVHHLFEHQAEKTPDSVAIVDGDVHLTYHMLNLRANQLARHLRHRLAVEKGHCVGLLFERSAEWITAMLAVLKTGAAYVPIDPAYPVSRILYMIENSGIQIVLTHMRVHIPDLEKRCTRHTAPATSSSLASFATMSPESLSSSINDTPRSSRGGGEAFLLGVDEFWEELGRTHHQSASASASASTSAGPTTTAATLNDSGGGGGGVLVGNPHALVTMDDLCYVIYTSGSTGKPKGVMVRHRGLASMQAWHTSEYGHTARDRASQMIGPGFDPVGLELWPFLTIGASVHIMPSDVRASPPGLVRWLCSHRITVALFATPVAESVLEEKWPEQCALRVMTAGGDKLHRVPAELPFPLDNHYGPSEATIITTFWRVPPGFKGAPPIGRPVNNTTTFVLDTQHDLHPVPVGVVGELYIGGECLAAGYMGRPELTREAFVHNPFSADPRSRLYRTGDLVRLLPSGDLEFVGRRDAQIKIRGNRIELGEIEAVLVAHEAVAEAVVTVGDRQRLCAYVVLRGSQQERNGGVAASRRRRAELELTSTLREHVKRSLPEYMVPAAFVTTERLPLTANQKVDRAALPAPDWSRLGTGPAAEFVAARTASEKLLCSIWASVLGLERVGVHDNFFELGGNSLTASVLIARIRDHFRLELSITQLFAAPTVSGIASHLGDCGESKQAEPTSVDVSGDAAVPDEVRAAVANATAEDWRRVRERRPRQILLTGATGFLGTHLLAELVAQTDAVIHCLVRGDIERVHESAKRYGLAVPTQRVMVVSGDLGEEALGLGAYFAVLAEQVDAIVHCGAHVNSILPYARLKAANVNGTREVLRLAATHHIKPVHFISTLSVGARHEHNTELPPPDDVHEGYALSKWVADRMVLDAGALGMPVTVFRPGRITGNAHSGVTSVEDFLCRFLKGCIQMGKGPDLDWDVDMNPVDFVSRTIVERALACQWTSNDEQRVFHLCNPRPLHLRKVFRWLRKFGYVLEEVPYEAWRDALFAAAQTSKDGRNSNHALAPMLPLFAEKCEDMGSRKTMPRPDTTKDVVASCPPVNGKLLETYFSHFVRCGFLPAPLEEQDEDAELELFGGMQV